MFDFPLNEIITFAAPKEISEFGMQVINSYLKAHYQESLPEWFSPILNGKDNALDLQGKFPKRVSNYFYKRFGIKLSEAELSKIGSLAGDYSTRKTYYFDFTNNIDWYRGDFGDDDSCFWGCRSNARGVISDYGYAVRFYHKIGQKHSGFAGFARAWLAKTHDGRLVVFNGYGMKTSEIASILSKYFKKPFKEIELYNQDMHEGLIYINGGGSAYCIGDNLEQIYSYDLGWPDDEFSPCGNCGQAASISEGHFVHDEFYCSECYSDCYSTCERCEDPVESIYNVRSRHYIMEWCGNCVDNWATRCDDCGFIWTDREITEIGDGYQVCPECLSRYYVCENCGEYFTEVNQNYLCEECHDQIESKEAEREMPRTD